MVAKVFQSRDTELVRSDLPTCSKESLWIILAIITAWRWVYYTVDIKAAFLQGKQFEKTIFLEHLPEADVPESYIWKLNKFVYGLNDTSWEW